MKRKPTALHLNVKAGGYTVRMGLTFTDTHGDVVEIPLQSDANREINFGQVATFLMHILYTLNHYHVACAFCMYRCQ